MADQLADDSTETPTEYDQSGDVIAAVKAGEITEGDRVEVDYIDTEDRGQTETAALTEVDLREEGDERWGRERERDAVILRWDAGDTDHSVSFHGDDDVEGRVPSLNTWYDDHKRREMGTVIGLAVAQGGEGDR